ncbi:hypothetical protein Tco_0357162 [Tanacetum coccineum]
MFFPLPPSLLNTPPSFLPLSPSLCLCDSDLPRLILEKTLAGSGLPDMLQERFDLHPLSCSLLTFGVLDSECCDISCIFEFLPGHPANGRSGTLVGQRSAAIVIADTDYLPQIVDLQVAYRRGM